jgi:hypothetical protein
LGLHFNNFDAKDSNQKPPSAASIGNQLVKLMNQELPEIFKKISTKTKDLKGAANFYLRFLKSTVGLNEEQEKACLELVRIVVGK